MENDFGDERFRLSDMVCRICGRELDDCRTCRCVSGSLEYVTVINPRSDEVDPEGDDQ